jgi:hypothetical protein
MRWALKGRTREGELYRGIIRRLRKHVGAPTEAQEMLIGRIAWLGVHLARMDEKAMESGDLSIHATREYLSWANAQSRMLQALGLELPAAAPADGSALVARAWASAKRG